MAEFQEIYNKMEESLGKYENTLKEIKDKSETDATKVEQVENATKELQQNMLDLKAELKEAQQSKMENSSDIIRPQVSGGTLNSFTPSVLHIAQNAVRRDVQNNINIANAVDEADKSVEEQAKEPNAIDNHMQA